MLDITYEIAGRKVHPRNLKNAMESAILGQLTDSIKKSVGSVRCAEHN